MNGASQRKLIVAQMPGKQTGLKSKAMTHENKGTMENKWISVNDELPDTGYQEEYPHASEFILLSDGEFVYYGQYEKIPDTYESFIDSNGDDFSDDGIEITHWMPLPAPPELLKQLNP